jgi:hypothetical protein
VAGAVACGVGDDLGCACGQTGSARARAINSPRSFLIIYLRGQRFGAEGDEEGVYQREMETQGKVVIRIV